MNNTNHMHPFVGFLCSLTFSFLVQNTSTFLGYSLRDLFRKLWYYNMYVHLCMYMQACMFHKLCCSYLCLLICTALESTRMPTLCSSYLLDVAPLSLHFPTLLNFSSWLLLSLGAIFVFGRRPVRLFLEILLSAWSYKECQGVCLVLRLVHCRRKKTHTFYLRVRKIATISFIISAVCLSVCPHGTTVCPSVHMEQLSVRLSTWNNCLSVCPHGTTVCPSVRMEQLGFHWKNFLLNLIFGYFSKVCQENSNFR